jgi:hypothetical protein
MDWSVLLARAFELLLLVFGPPAAALAVWAVKKLKDKLHVEAGLLEDRRVYAAAVQGVAWAEEWARQRGALGTTGSQKLDAALSLTKTILQEPAVKKYTEEGLRKIIEAVLNQRRAADGGEVPCGSSAS